MAYFYIEFGCGCGTNEEFIEAESLFEAENIAYQNAIDNYECYEGLHGIRGTYEIALEDFCNEEEEEVDQLTDEQWKEVEQIYLDERESCLSYGAKEVTYKQYIHEDLYWEDDEDKDEEDVLD